MKMEKIHNRCYRTLFSLNIQLKKDNLNVTFIEKKGIKFLY